MEKPSAVSPLRFLAVHHQPYRIEVIIMHIYLSLAPLVALISGILILVMPRLLNYIVAIYLIVIGLLELFGGGFHMR